MPENDLQTQLAGLQSRVREADNQRARAEATHEAAVRRLTEVDAQIKALGVEPDQAEAELAKLQQELLEQMAALDTALKAEVDAYQKILAADRA